MQDEVKEVSLWRKIPNSWYIYIFLISCFFFFLPITNFFRSVLFLFCIECLAESIEKKVKKFFSGKKDMGDISSRVDAGSADAKKNHGKLLNRLSDWLSVNCYILASFGNCYILLRMQLRKMT